MMPMTLAKSTVGLMSGSLMLKNMRTGLLPSTVAASSTSTGTAAKAATNRMNVNPSCCQVATSTIVAVAPAEVLNHGTAGR